MAEERKFEALPPELAKALFETNPARETDGLSWEDFELVEAAAREAEEMNDAIDQVRVIQMFCNTPEEINLVMLAADAREIIHTMLHKYHHLVEKHEPDSPLGRLLAEIFATPRSEGSEDEQS